jgi:hypothetical protein
MNRPLLAAIAVATALALAGPAAAQAPQRTKVGTLTCDISGGVGMIIGSQQAGLNVAAGVAELDLRPVR